MTQQIGYKNGQMVIYDPSDPLSSYGVTPATTVQTQTQTSTGQIVTGTTLAPSGPPQYPEVPAPGGGVVTFVSPTGEATQLAKGGPLQGTIQTSISTSTTVAPQNSMPSSSISQTDVLTAGTQSNFSVAYSSYLGKGQWKNIVKTDTGMKEVITGKGPLSWSSPLIQPIMTGLEIKPNLEGKGIAYQGAAGFMSGVVGTMFLPITLPIAAINLAKESSVAGSGYIPFKVEEYAKNIITTATTQPVFFTGSLIGSVAGGKALTDVVGAVKSFNKQPTEIAGEMTLNTQMMEENIRGTGTGKFASPKTKTGIDIEFESVTKDMSGFQATVERGTLEAKQLSPSLSKIAGQDVFRVRETSFAEFGMTADMTDITNVGGSVTATGLKEVTKSGNINRLAIGSPDVDIWQSFSKSKGANVLAKTEVLKNLPEVGGGGGSLFYKMDFSTAGLSQNAFQISKVAGEAISNFPKTSLPILPIPQVIKTNEIQTNAGLKSSQIIDERAMFKSISTSINVPKSIEKTAIPVFTPQVSSLQNQFEGLKNIVNPIQIPFSMSSQLSKKTPIQTPFDIPIQYPTQTPTQIPIQIPKQIPAQISKTFTPTSIIPKVSPPTFALPPMMGSIEGFVPRRFRSPFRKRGRKYSYAPSVGSAILGFKSPRIPKGFGGFSLGVEMRPLIVPKSKRGLYKKSRQLFTIPKQFRRKKR